MLQIVKKHTKLIDWVFPNYSWTTCRKHEETVPKNRDVVTDTIIIKLQQNQVEMNSMISLIVFTPSIPALTEFKNLSLRR